MRKEIANDLDEDEDEVTSTSLDPDPEEELLDDRGLVTVISPRDASLADDTEDDDAYAALLEDLSPGEASRVLEDFRPLSEEEEEIVEDLPELGTLSKVDDSEHEKFLAAISRRGYGAMDDVLEDSVYGDHDMTTNEEILEREGSDDEAGFSIPGLSTLKSVAKKAYRYGKKGVTMPGKLAYRYGKKGLRAHAKAARWVGRRATGVVKKFVPSRDRAKAKLVSDLNKRLVREHANWLAVRDQKGGRKVGSLAHYINQSRGWARAQIARSGLPTSTRVSGADVLGAEIIGTEVGSWYNPFTWFDSIVNAVVKKTAGQRSAEGPQGGFAPEGQQGYPQEMYPQEAYPQEAYPQEAYPQEAYPQDMYPQDMYPQEAYPQEAYADPYAQYADPYASYTYGDDDLGGFTGEVLSGPSKRGPAPKDANKVVSLAVAKLRRGTVLTAGELAVVATLAKTNERAKKLYAILLKKGAPAPGTSVSGKDDSGAWLHMMNPLYWFKSSDERKLIDKERDRWKQNADLREELEKRQRVLAQAQRAKKAEESVAAARAQAASTEAQIKAIQSQLTGLLLPEDSSGWETFVGHEKPTPVTDVVRKALERVGKTARARQIYDKIASREPLTDADLKDARTIVKMIRKVKVVHGDLKDPPELAMVHGALAGACMLGDLAEARKENGAVARAARALQVRSASRPLTGKEKKAAVEVLDRTKRLRGEVRRFTSGEAFRGLDEGTGLRDACFVGAARAAMTPAEKKMLGSIQKLAQAGNPRAVEALRRLRQSGSIMGGDHVEVGFNLTQAFKYATAPVWLPAKHLYQAAKWTGKKLGIVSSSKSPQQQRLDMMRAAAKRRQAALARALAADAQTRAEFRAQDAIAQAADAEAEALEAESLAKEAAMKTKEVEADPTQYVSEEDVTEGVGQDEEAFVGQDDEGIEAFVGQDDDEGIEAFVGEGEWEPYVATEDESFVGKAKQKSRAGRKVRAGARLYARAKAKDPRAVKAVQKIVAKAKKGDKQALRDVTALKAGQKAYKAKKRAERRRARMLARKARKAKVRAVQKRVEARIANKLARAERRTVYTRLAYIERKAAQGNKKAVAYVRAQAELAKKGDKRAADRVRKLALAKRVRTAAPTRRERRNLAAAGKLYRRAKRRDRRAVRDVLVVQAAAKKGNPNARRAVKRLKIARDLETVVTIGPIAVAAAVAKKKAEKKRSRVGKAKMVSKVVGKARAGKASREELAAASQAARDLGDGRASAALAKAATAAPSATAKLQKVAAVVAAKNAGDREARAAIDDSLAKAKTGDVGAIKKAGGVVAVNTLRDIEEGKPVSPAMRDAVNLQERAAVGDPAAVEEVQRVTAAATEPNPVPEATAAAVTLAAAAATAKAMASRPKTREKFIERVNAVPPEARGEAEQALGTYVAEAEAGTITPERGVKGVRLAERLGKPKLAAKIAALSPPAPEGDPRSSLPDSPLAPIRGPLNLVVESVRALTMTTQDPIANFREGIGTRAYHPGAVSGMGWSPFDYFRKMIPGGDAAWKLTKSLFSAGKKTAKAAAPAARDVAVAPAEVTKDAAVKTVKGSAKVAKVASSAARKTGEAVAEATEEIVGAEKSFKDYLSEALTTKKMRKRDFNRAVRAHVGPTASGTKLRSVGEKLLKMLSDRGVKVET